MKPDPVVQIMGRNDEDGNQIAVDWLLRLRQLQRENGLSFDAALAIANSEFPEG
jgi:hypothetical protein